MSGRCAALCYWELEDLQVRGRLRLGLQLLSDWLLILGWCSARRREGIRVRSGLARDSGGLSIDCLVRPFRCCFCWNKELASLSWHFVLDIPRRIQVGCGVPLFSPATRHLESIRNFQRIEARDRVCGFVREIMSNSLGQQAHISDNTATVATEVVRDPTPMSDPCRGCTSSNWRNVTLLTRMTAGPWK
jgi:hypothetical protein